MRNALISRFDIRLEDPTYHPSQGGLRPPVRRPHEIVALEEAGLIKVKLHLSYWNERHFDEAEVLDWGKVRIGFKYGRHRSEASVLDVPTAPRAITQKMERTLYQFLQLQARVYAEPKPHLARKLYADEHLFYRLLNFFYDRIQKYEIDLLLFDEPPHYGLDYVIYSLGKTMGIRTIMFLQNVHTERTLVGESIEDFGELLARPVLSEPMRIPIEKRFEKQLYAAVDPTRDALNERLLELHGWQVIPKHAKHLVRLGLIYAGELVCRRLGISPGRLTSAGDVSARKLHRLMATEMRRSQALETLECVEQYANDAPNLGARFVYFALHMQPELTTYPLGGEYSDQLRALEHLRDLVPDDVRIYVKEHPHSNGSMRESDFYLRLRAIPNTELVSADVASHDLLARCEFVATITGTVGWEAITGGKPALCFGHAWYSGLPGVFKMTEAPTYAEITGCRIEHELVQEGFRELSRRFGDFTPAWGFDLHQYPNNYDLEANTARFVEAMRSLLASK